MSTDLPFDKSQAQRTMDSDRTMFSSSPPRPTIPSFTNSPPSPPSNTKRSSYSSPPPKNTSSSHKETSYSSVSSNSHENEQQRLAQEQQASYAMQDFGSRSNLNTNPYPLSSKEELDEEFQPPRPAYQQPLNNSGSGSDGGSVRSGNESSDDGLTATDSEDEFDWDEDDALEKEKEDATGMVRGKHRAKRGRRVYLWLMSLSRWFRTIIVAMFGCGVAIVPFVVVTVEYKGNPAKTEVQAWSLFLCIGWAVGCATSVIVDFLPNVFIMIILYSMGRVPEKIKSYVELLISILGWLKLLLQVVFAWVVLSVVRAAVSPPGNYWVYINRVMMALFAASLILLVEKFFLQVVAIGFHATSLKDRLEENHSALRALDKLSNAVPRIYARPNHHGFHHNRNKSHSNSNTNTTNTPSQSRPSSRPGSPAPIDYGYAPGTPSPLVNEKGPEGGVNTEEGKKRRSRFGIRARREERKEEKREETKKKKKNVAAKMVGGLGKSLKEFANKGMFGKGPEIGSLSSARQLARKLFANLEKERTGDVDGERVLIVEDFLPYFRNLEDAKSAFRHFDSDDNGDVSKREMRSAVQRIYRERKSLTASLADMSSAISKLDGVLLGVGVIIFIFAAMLIFNRSSTVASLVPLSTIVLGFSFIFANSAKTLFESLIFIFATHAFDVGDLVLIDEDWLFVKEFGLVSTTFRRVDGQEIIAPNALLATSKLIHNIRRSRAMWEVTSIQISYDTPLDVIEDLKTRVKAYLTENSREWGGGMQLDIDSITKQNAIAINIAIEHRNNWQDWGGRWGRRTAFMKALKGFLEDLEVTYSLPIQPVIWPSGIEDGSGGPMRPLPPGALEFGNAGSGGPYSSSGHLNAPGAGRPSLSVNTTRTSR